MGIVLLWVICLGIPLGGLYVCIKEHKRAYRFFGVGVIVYIVVQVCMHIPLFRMLYTSESFLTWTSAHSLVYIILLSVSAAIIEEIGRWLGYRFLKNSTVHCAIALGLGLALVEVVHTVIVPYVSYGQDLSFQVYALVCIERLCAIVLQVALSLLVWKASQEHSLVYLLTAVLLHTIYILVPSILSVLMAFSSAVSNVILLAMTGAIAWYSYTTVCKSDEES